MLLAAFFGRRQMRIELCCQRPVLLARLQLREQEALGYLEGDEVNHDQLSLEYGSSSQAWGHWPHAFVQGFARALRSPHLPTTDGIRLWLEDRRMEPGLLRTRLPLEIYDDRLASWQRQCVKANRLPELLAAHEIAAIFARTTPLSRGNVVLSLMLGDRCITAAKALSSGGLVALGMAERNIPWSSVLYPHPSEDADDPNAADAVARSRQRWLEAVAAGGEAIVELARRVDRWTALVDQACTSRRRSSRLREAANMTASCSSITASRLSSRLGVSKQGAINLLDAAVACRLVREITQGNAFRRYVAAI